MARGTAHRDAEQRQDDQRLQPAEVVAEGWRRVATMRKGEGMYAGLELLRHDSGNRAVLKHFAHRGAIFRRTAGAVMARREVAAYRRLRSVRGVPRLIGRVGPDGFLIEYVDCCRPRDSPEALTNEFFEGLREILRGLGRRGVIHGDICRNARIDRSGRPWLMDFGASFVIRAWLRPFRGRLRAIVQKYDDHAVAVLKQRVAPELLSGADRETISQPLPFRAVMTIGRRLLSGLIPLLVDKAPMPADDVD